jgi:hypothetical protein
MVRIAFSQPATTFVMTVAALVLAAPAAFAQERITAARFSITIDGYEIAAFSELAGITRVVDRMRDRAALGRSTTKATN